VLKIIILLLYVIRLQLEIFFPKIQAFTASLNVRAVETHLKKPQCQVCRDPFKKI